MKRKKILICGLLAALLLSACNGISPAIGETVGNLPPADQTEQTLPAAAQAPVTEPPATVPPDGAPGDVTCKGTYTGQVVQDKVVATVGEGKLTAGVLQVYYWNQVAAYRAGDAQEQPDYSQPLDTQTCPIDDTVGSWQQYFLKQALDSWHSVEALNQVSKVDPIHRDEKYNPNPDNHVKYMEGMPVLPLLYGYSTEYTPNSMHQSYLDELPQTIEDLAVAHGYFSGEAMAEEAFGTDLASLLAFADGYNRAYMYETYLSYYVTPTQEEADAYFAEHPAQMEEAGIVQSEQRYVDIRHLLLPAGEEGEQTAQELDKSWQGALKSRVQDFAELANRNSQDSGTSNDGGAYYRLLPGMLEPELEQWCFDQERVAGDHTIVSLADGVHMLYFCGSTPTWQAQALDWLTVEQQRDLIVQARERFPIQVRYSDITLGEGSGTVCAEEVLYPDVAHERYPEVPLYLQQDFIGTWYGNYPVHTHGCGITTMAMLASYMADDELTVPMMCARFGARYSLEGGTDAMLFTNEPKGMGFYLIKRSFDEAEAYQAIKDGHIVVTLEHKGYWTTGGHYLVLEKVNESGNVQVRDSNTFNYFRVKTHQQDEHPWSTIVGAADGYWIYDYKVTRIPLCQRCGTPEQTQGGLVAEYTCHKCRTALMRREAFLSMT